MNKVNSTIEQSEPWLEDFSTNAAEHLRQLRYDIERELKLAQKGSK